MIGKSLLLVAALFGATGTVAETPDLLLLTAVLHDGERIVGEPRLTMAAGEPGRITISERPNEQYDLTVTALPSPDGTIVTRWSIHARSAYGDRAATPTLTVLPDKPSAIAFGEESATARPFRIDFKLSKAN